tara:strand:- start:512 stop:703 length:192 start_codon:yes stop_codon:yes gene_type:complete
MKFSAIVALIASTQAIQLKSKSAVKAEGDVVLTINGGALMNIMEQLDELSAQVEELVSNPAIE